MRKLVRKIHKWLNEKMKVSIKIFLLLLLTFNLLGQEVRKNVSTHDCTVVIQNSEKYFQDGLYEKCITDLEYVISYCALSKSDKAHAMELLAKAYVETGDIEKADGVVNKMLIKFPHYELDEKSNYEQYNRLVRKYVVHPKISVGLRNTADWISYHTTKVYSVLDGLDYSISYNQNYEGILHGFGWMYYGWGEIEFDKGISLNGDLIFKFSSYSRNLTKEPGFFLDYWEKDNYMEIPVYIKKYLRAKKDVLPYVTAGLGWIYLTKASGNVYISYTKDDVITGKNIDFISGTYDIDMMEMRNRHIFEYVIGTGIGYKIKNLRLFLDARFYGGLNTLTNADKRLANNELVNTYFYVDNSVRINQFEFGASVSYTLFNSVKKQGR